VSESTTVRVSKTTLEMLERLRNRMNAKTLDEAKGYLLPGDAR